MKTKNCTKCGIEKNLSEFHKDSSKLYGVRGICKLCIKASDANRYLANPEKIKARAALWKLTIPGYMKSYDAARYEKNKEKIKARSAAWRAANPEKQKAQQLAWKAANHEKLRIIDQNRRARKMLSGGKLSKDIASKLMVLQRGRCACCKLPLGDDYHIDHIIPLALGGANTDENIQLLRGLCNRKKGPKHPIEYMQSKGMLL